ncbi:hypothetical protein K503DRAFT_743810 [Rhizopogon vinicolor AM-OR11-026]|uniref:Uncharacterized protein n=1 Tax=Rhizopogon vinicolor AM-OR11-026 TaxID=1314800 RepID=A0A1B7MVZ4_9AGAM|nr:hypothetical protein K503DRAFT_743810 [Rhizopogon vinicolor AM-OR11-026]
MPKRSSRACVAIENLQGWAKKRKVSEDADKENKHPALVLGNSPYCVSCDSAYNKGLNGSQAAWAAKKYRGHRVLPSSILAELDAAKII